MGKMVYHYCSLETLLNILEHKTIRLSDINKLNDSNESKALLHITRNRAISLMLSQLEEKGEEYMGGMAYREFVVYLIDKMIEQVKGYHDLLTYIACFSESDDCLSQWRGYGDDGRGVAIGFDVDAIRELLREEDAHQLEFRKVRYIDTDVNTLFCDTQQCDLSISIHASNLVHTLMSYIDQNKTQQILNGSYMATEEGQWFLPLLQDSFFYKDDSFAEETEWRLILKDEIIKSEENWGQIYNWSRCPQEDKTVLQKLFPKALCFRPTENDIISYMDLDFSAGEPSANDMIQEIIIGPNCRLMYQDVFQLLAHFGFDVSGLKVRRSASTYRI